MGSSPPPSRGSARFVLRDVAQPRSPSEESSSTRRPGSREAPGRALVPEARERARALGLRAERAAAEHLIEAGLAILATNVHVGRYEIDLLAVDGAVLVVVEVRARGPGALVRPLDSIDWRKRARVRAAGAQLWRGRFSKDARFERMRFDCVAVTVTPSGDTRIEHVRAAF